MSEQLDGQQAGAAPQQDGVLKDPLSVRNTDTGSMKRMAAEGAAGQARKTIKLKPLASKKGGVGASDLTSASITAASATAAPAAAPSPTSTSPSLDAGVADQATVAMERAAIDDQTRKLQKPQVPTVAVVSSSSFAGVAAAPAHSLPGSKQTIKLRPSTTGSAPEAAPAAAAAPAPVMQKPVSAQTIKLTPKSAAPAAVPAAAPAAAPAAPAPSSVPPGVTSTAPDIKNIQTVAIAKNTIRLVPKKAEVQSSAPVQPKPSDPTVNLQAAAPAGVMPSEPTTRLAPTQMIPPPSPAAEAAPAAEPKTKIGLKHYTQPPPMPSEGAEQAIEELEGAETNVAVKDEPNIIFMVAAILSLCTIGFLSFVLFAQYDNHWWNGNVSVPGLHKLSGTK